jgi:hypothetical protein
MGTTANSFPCAAAGFAAVFLRKGLALDMMVAQLEKPRIWAHLRPLTFSASVGVKRKIRIGHFAIP